MRSFFPTRLAEILFALVIGSFGVMHLMDADTMSGAIPDNIPGDGKMLVYIAGAGLIAAALAILINKLKMPACYLLAAMLLVFVFAIHMKSFETNPSGVLKDTAIAMAAIIIGNRGSK